ncbi:MAG TPA: xanthine dehydrogenase family protein subunit M [Woeseiaceae bacterium]|nr:xanthine dehydrogenase family protein subunit M [Woeseiaceae bacterium]
MYPSAFNYHRPGSVDSAIRLLSDIGEGARVLAGGQTLIVLLKLRFDEPTDLVDIARIPALDRIDDQSDTISIGALATHRRIAESALASAVPIVGDCANGIADNQVRSRGTIGGSLASGDPSCDWPSLLHTLDAEIDVQGPDGSRTLDINGFVEDLYQTVLKPGEIITGVRFPRPAAGSGGAYCAFKRCAPAYPTVSAGVQLTLAQDGRIGSARVALGSAGLTPIRALDAEQELTGKQPDAAALERAAAAAVAASDPVDDQRGSAAFKRRLVASLTKRAVQIALRRAGGETVKNSHEYY